MWSSKYERYFFRDPASENIVQSRESLRRAFRVYADMRKDLDEASLKVDAGRSVCLNPLGVLQEIAMGDV